MIITEIWLKDARELGKFIAEKIGSLEGVTQGLSGCDHGAIEGVSRGLIAYTPAMIESLSNHVWSWD
ncbi:MAG: hypothetical protein U9P81_01590 [Euryarchaeota archaeon]|nr:hypothetical protein [Euryarchaeota archaeon]